MPYLVVKRKGPRPWKIIKKDTGEIVGSSTSKARALRSVGYRMGAESKTKKKKKVKHLYTLKRGGKVVYTTKKASKLGT